jgi:predicted ATP-dependent serine protease
VLGDLVPGAMVSIAGHPGVGKTALLLDAAIRIHRSYGTNVVFATAVSFNKLVHSRQQTDPGFQLTTAHALTGGGRSNSSQATQHASL